MKAVVSPKEGWEGYVMRIVKFCKDGYSPEHSHNYPHINYVIKGKGLLIIDGKENDLNEGSFSYVPNEAIHQYKIMEKTKWSLFV